MSCLFYIWFDKDGTIGWSFYRISSISHRKSGKTKFLKNNSHTPRGVYQTPEICTHPTPVFLSFLKEY